MITLTSTGGDFSASFQADYASLVVDAYLRSKTMLTLQRLDQQKLSLFGIYFSWVGGYTSTVYYYTAPDGSLSLPLRNILESIKANSPEVIHINLCEVGSTVAVDSLSSSINIHEGLSYFDANAPVQKDAPQLYWGHRHDLVLPPNVIINPDSFGGGAAPGIIVESNYHIFDNNAVWNNVIGGLSATITPSGSRSTELQVNYAADLLRIAAGKDNDQIKEWPLTKTDDCIDLVCIRWTSQTGAVRQHYFPVVSYIKGSDKQVSLISAGDGYLVDKNTYNSVLCRLTGLTQYGYWYYMDLVQASDAHAIIQPTFASFNDEMASEQTAAFIDATDMATPEGVGFFNFEFIIKLRHYGTL